MCLQQTDLDRTSPEETATRFVVSLFGARDDIKSHYSAERARVCGATWEAFFGYSGVTAEDVWGGIEEGDRKLWSVSVVAAAAVCGELSAFIFQAEVSRIGWDFSVSSGTNRGWVVTLPW